MGEGEEDDEEAWSIIGMRKKRKCGGTGRKGGMESGNYGKIHEAQKI